MKIAFFQRLDQEGGGSRASLRVTIEILRDQRPSWPLILVTESMGPLSQKVSELGVVLRHCKFSRFRKLWKRFSFWNSCYALERELEVLEVEKILSNEWVTAPHASKVARYLGVPSISYVRDFSALRRGRKYQLDKMDRLLCVCEAMRQGLIREGYDPDKVRTVYDPVLRPLTLENDLEVRSQIARTVGVDRWLLYLGRISPRKSQVETIQMLKCLREVSGQRWGLLLAGDSDESYIPLVDCAVKDADLCGVVLRLGMIKEPGWLFDLVDASVMTSKSEGLARVLIESFLCGKPGFSFPVAGLEDIFGDDLDLFVTKNRDPMELAKKIAFAFDGEVDFRDRIEAIGTMLDIRHSCTSHCEAFEDAMIF